MDKKVIPFSNGTEFMNWNETNCCQCKRYENKSTKVENSNCIIAFYLDLGTIEGEIPKWVMDALKYNKHDFWNCQFKQIVEVNNG